MARIVSMTIEGIQALLDTFAASLDQKYATSQQLADLPNSGAFSAYATDSEVTQQLTNYVAKNAANSVMFTSGTTRPTTSTNVMVIFVGADPGAAAKDNDIWLQP